MVCEIYTIKYSYIYIFSLTFMLFCVWLYNIFVLQVTRVLHAKWGQANWIKSTYIQPDMNSREDQPNQI